MLPWFLATVSVLMFCRSLDIVAPQVVQPVLPPEPDVVPEEPQDGGRRRRAGAVQRPRQRRRLNPPVNGKLTLLIFSSSSFQIGFFLLSGVMYGARSVSVPLYSLVLVSIGLLSCLLAPSHESMRARC